MTAHAAVLFRPERHYRREAFAAGLRRHGFEVGLEARAAPRPGDVLLLWNRFQRAEPIARRYEGAGAAVLVAENGYAGHDAEGGSLFALAHGHHNGAGEWPYLPGRWQAQGLSAAPWRVDGEHVLVLLQRGIGERGVAQPRNWVADISARLARATRRPVRVRPHPGRVKAPSSVSAAPSHLLPGGAKGVLTDGSLEADLAGAHCCVTWGSGAGIKALLAGVPVLHEFRHWIGGIGGPPPDLGAIETPPMRDRTGLLEALGSAQWSLAEIEAGTAFGVLLD